VVLYLSMGAVGLALWEFSFDGSVTRTLAALVITIAWGWPLWIAVSVVVSICLGALRVLSTLRWYWFRLVAVLLFAVPLPLFLLAGVGPETALPVAALQVAMALLIVQPGEGDGWSSRDPAMEDHG
jgi:hypothetical protein